MKLFQFQQALINECRTAFRAGYRRPLLVLPTGGGKGEIFSTIIRDAASRGQRIGFIVPRSELVRDFSRRLDRYGVPHGVYHGQNSRSTHLPIQVASIPTLVSRAKRGLCPKFSLLIADEAHLSMSDGCQQVIEATGAQYVIGGTATPCRLDGRALGDTYDIMLRGPSVSDLQKLGRLVYYRHLSASLPDMTGISDTDGEAQDEALRKAHVYGDVVDTWGKHGRGRPAIGFFANKRGSIETAERFQAAGVPAVHVDAMTPFRERDRIWTGLADGLIPFVCSVGIISLGWDVPAVSYEAQVCHTDSLAKYLQMVGRELRASPDKSDAILADHAGNWITHGFADDDRDWSLDGKRGGADDMPAELRPRVCPDCETLAKRNAEQCGVCGYIFYRVQAAQRVEMPDVVLTDVRAGSDAMARLSGVSNQKQAAMLKRFLREARQRYMEETGKEARPHWSSQMITAILSRNRVSV